VPRWITSFTRMMFSVAVQSVPIQLFSHQPSLYSSAHTHRHSHMLKLYQNNFSYFSKKGKENIFQLTILHHLMLWTNVFNRA